MRKGVSYPVVNNIWYHQGSRSEAWEINHSPPLILGLLRDIMGMWYRQALSRKSRTNLSNDRLSLGEPHESTLLRGGSIENIEDKY